MKAAQKWNDGKKKLLNPARYVLWIKGRKKYVFFFTFALTCAVRELHSQVAKVLKIGKISQSRKSHKSCWWSSFWRHDRVELCNLILGLLESKWGLIEHCQHLRFRKCQFSGGVEMDIYQVHKYTCSLSPLNVKRIKYILHMHVFFGIQNATKATSSESRCTNRKMQTSLWKYPWNFLLPILGTFFTCQEEQVWYTENNPSTTLRL